MNCSQCQTANPEGAKFCMSCGSPLAASCPECGAELPTEARFCLNCGHQLGHAAEAASVRAQLEQYIPNFEEIYGLKKYSHVLCTLAGWEMAPDQCCKQLSGRLGPLSSRDFEDFLRKRYILP